MSMDNPHEMPGRTAEGDINPCRIIKGGTAPNAALQCTSNVKAVGIALPGQKAPATTSGGVAAAAGDPIAFFGPGQIGLVECAGNIGVDVEFVSDTNGKAVAVGTTSGTVYQVCGWMIDPGAAGRFARCIFWPYTKSVP